MAKYQKPGALTMRLVNPLIATLTKLGLSVRGAMWRQTGLALSATYRALSEVAQGSQPPRV